MKDYFRLHEEVFLFNDFDGSGVIYNLFNGNVYNISSIETNFLISLENNESIDKALSLIPEECWEYVKERLFTYEKNDLGAFYSQPVYINKLIIDYNAIENIPVMSRIRLTKAIISLSNECSNDCKFCYPEQYIGDISCVCCSGREKHSIQKYMEKRTLEKIILALTRLRCRNVVIKIPEIDSNIDYYIDCINFIEEADLDTRTIVIGNNTRRGNLDKLVSKNINILLQKEIRNKSKINDAISQYTEITKGPYYNKVSFIFIYYNDDIKELFMEELEKIDGKKTNYILSKYFPRNNISEINSSRPKYFNRTGLESFSYNQCYHPCLGGLIYFDQNGDVYPCPNLLDLKFGNIENFKDVWNQNGLNTFWKQTRIDNIQKCNKCGMRYVCNDCRANEYLLSNNILGKVTCNRVNG